MKIYKYDENQWIDKLIKDSTLTYNWQLVDKAWDVLSQKRSLSTIIVEIQDAEHYKIVCDNATTALDKLHSDLQEIVREAIHSYITGKPLPDYIWELN